MNLEITQPAEEDLNDILKYGYDVYGENQARKYVRNIYGKLAMLINFPNLGHSRIDIPDTHKALRVEREHIAIYRQQDDTIFVVRVLHSNMDFTKQDIH